MTKGKYERLDFGPVPETMSIADHLLLFFISTDIIEPWYFARYEIRDKN
jgi:hypothetical protein